MVHWIQRHRLLCIAGLAGVLIVSAFVMLLGRSFQLDVYSVVSSLLMVMALAGLGFVIRRWVHFRARLIRLLRLLLEGKYEAGITMTHQGLDEVGALERMLDKLAEQLRIYDTLRAERIRQSQRLLTVLLENMLLPVMLLDVATEMLQCNPAWRTLVGVDKETISLKALKSIEANGAFMDLLTQAIDTVKTPQEGDASVQFPSQEDKHTMSLRILPLKDKQEAVFAAIILGSN